MKRIPAFLPLFCVLAWESAADAAPTKVHVVQRNQTLLGIAQHYRTTVEEVARLNRLGAKTALRPGQKLVVPDVEAAACEDPSDPKTVARCKDRERTLEKLRKLCDSGRKLNRRDEEACERLDATEPETPPEAPAAKPAPAGPREAAAAGGEDESLEARCHLARRCAERVRETEQAKQCHGPKRTSNECKPVLARERSVAGLKRHCTDRAFFRKHTADCEEIRHRDHVRKELAARCERAKPTSELQERCAKAAKPAAAATAFARAPKRAGIVKIHSPMGRFEGPLFLKGRTNPAAIAPMRRVMATDGRDVNPALFAHLTKISDHFGGREIEVMSGFRPQTTNRYTKASRHNEGKASDIRILGVPNEALWAFCRTLPLAGCGLYPNSTFVHVDTRTRSFYWTDYAGAGEPPMYAHEGWIGRYRRKGSDKPQYPWEAWKRFEEEQAKRKGDAAGKELGEGEGEESGEDKPTPSPPGSGGPKDDTPNGDKSTDPDGSLKPPSGDRPNGESSKDAAPPAPPAPAPSAAPSSAAPAP